MRTMTNSSLSALTDIQVWSEGESEGPLSESLLPFSIVIIEVLLISTVPLAQKWFWKQSVTPA